MIWRASPRSAPFRSRLREIIAAGRKYWTSWRMDARGQSTYDSESVLSELPFLLEQLRQASATLAAIRADVAPST
jgi:hypothetical protein